MPVCLPPREAYRLWAETWDEDPSPVGALESLWVARWLGDVRGRRVVDAGCGTGRWMRYLRERGAVAAGFDLSAPMLARAAAWPALHGTLAAADLGQLPVAAACADIALCALSLGHAPDADLAMRELCRVVKPGGMLLLSDFHPDATRRGWKRTFRRGGETFEVENHAYSVEALALCAAREGLRLEAVAEPGFDDGQREIFRRAGREDLFLRVRGLPAVVVARWRRVPCS